MKIILVSEHFFPVSRGGTEQYVYFLAKGLIELGHQVIVLSVHAEMKDNVYDLIPIHYIRPYIGNDLHIIRGLKPADNLEQFINFIKEEKPSIVHFHTLTSSLNRYHILEVKKLGIKALYTSHIPGDLCIKGNLMQNGNRVCNGKVSLIKCSACVFNSRQSSFFKSLLRFFTYVLPLKHSAVKRKKDELKILVKTVDRFITVSAWQMEYWKKNIQTVYPIAICRQGVTVAGRNNKVKDKRFLRIGFAGRISKVKGLHLLFEALKGLESPYLEILIAGIPSDKEDEYYCSLKSTILPVPVRWFENLNAEAITSFYQEIDYLVVPSLWLETGPFVVYEALSSGTPVIASNLGGMKELIQNGVNGYLFEPNVQSLTALLDSLSFNKPLLLNAERVRDDREISKDMEIIYSSLLS